MKLNENTSVPVKILVPLLAVSGVIYSKLATIDANIVANKAQLEGAATKVEVKDWAFRFSRQNQGLNVPEFPLASKIDKSSDRLLSTH